MLSNTEENIGTESPFSDATQQLIDASSLVVDTTSHHQKVARRIRELEDEIRSLKTCHNAVTVTCRIPVEILANVLHYIAFSVPEPWLRDTEKSRSYRWIGVTHVCRHWRSTAIDSTALWTRLNFEESPKLVGVMFERSRGVPVDVLWRHHMVSLPNANTLPLSLSQVNRIRSLKISSNHKGDLGTLQEILCLPQWTGCASTLAELELEISSTFSTFSLPEAFLKGGTPILSRLRVHGCKVGLGRLLFSSTLTTLELRGKAATPLSASSLLETFGQMRLLQTLRLYDFLDFCPSITRTLQSASLPLFTFPSLRNMAIQGCPKDVNCFLQLSRSDSAVSVKLDKLLVPQAPLVDDSQQILGNILNWWGYSSTETKLNVKKFCLGVELELVLYFDPETEPPGPSSSRGKNRLSILSTKIPPLRQSLDILQRQYNFQTLTSVTSGAIYPGCWRSDVWRFFASLPDLKEICLRRPDHEELGDLFEVLQEDTGPLGINHTITFPSLSIITILCSSFHNSNAETIFGRFVTAFTAIARRRQPPLCRISELRLVVSEGIEAAEIARLRESNPGLTVVWDGDSSARGDALSLASLLPVSALPSSD